MWLFKRKLCLLILPPLFHLVSSSTSSGCINNQDNLVYFSLFFLTIYNNLNFVHELCIECDLLVLGRRLNSLVF